VNTSRRFPPPWSVDDPDMKLGQDCFIVRDASGPRLRLFRGRIPEVSRVTNLQAQNQ
jgi:hypothetical protein